MLVGDLPASEVSSRHQPHDGASVKVGRHGPLKAQRRGTGPLLRTFWKPVLTVDPHICGSSIWHTVVYKQMTHAQNQTEDSLGRSFCRTGLTGEQSHGWVVSARLRAGGEAVLVLNQRARRVTSTVDPSGPMTLSHLQSEVQHVIPPGSFCSWD